MSLRSRARALSERRGCSYQQALNVIRRLGPRPAEYAARWGCGLTTADWVTSGKMFFHDDAVRDWRRAIADISSGATSGQLSWASPHAIVEVLNRIAQAPNHAMYPDSGGNDLDSARPAIEPGSIELSLGDSPHIVRPSNLMLELINRDTLWAYLWLQTESVPPIKGGSSVTSYEYLMEDAGGSYRSFREEGRRAGERSVTRYFRAGAFLFVCKRSLYNLNTGTYDGRHQQLGHAAFRQHMEELVAYWRREHTNADLGLL